MIRKNLDQKPEEVGNAGSELEHELPRLEQSVVQGDAIEFRVLGDPGRDNALFVKLKLGHTEPRLLFDCGENCLNNLSVTDKHQIDSIVRGTVVDHRGHGLGVGRTEEGTQPTNQNSTCPLRSHSSLPSLPHPILSGNRASASKRRPGSRTI